MKWLPLLILCTILCSCIEKHQIEVTVSVYDWNTHDPIKQGKIKLSTGNRRTILRREYLEQTLKLNGAHRINTILEYETIYEPDQALEAFDIYYKSADNRSYQQRLSGCVKPHEHTISTCKNDREEYYLELIVKRE